MYSCAKCGVKACRGEERDKLPKNCPIRDEALLEEALEAYQEPENRQFYIKASEIESMGYGEWNRVKETMTLCRVMGYKRLGLAFCGGLHKEGKVLTEILERNGFEIVSVMCKAGGTDKCRVGISEDRKVQPGAYEPMCNPIFQAKLLNSQDTEFNIVLGLCVGHDTMFYKYSQAMVTTIAVKDRALGHNPIAALYQADGYCRKKLDVD